MPLCALEVSLFVFFYYNIKDMDYGYDSNVKLDPNFQLFTRKWTNFRALWVFSVTYKSF